ncbi:MAG: heme ABC transporter permease CcmC [Gammaproteobacteria bacterium]|nr:heme ABC transporter permease CcmC [Gammaproteobacteria bacterium]
MKNKFTIWWHRLGSPHYFEELSQRFAPWCNAFALILLSIGCAWGIFFTPADFQQNDAFRIIYVHVPAAAMSMGIYVSMAFASILYFVWNIKLGAYYCRSLATLGAAFTLLALFTGAVWGKPMWGTYWTWGDPRLLSELILLFLYLGYIGIISSIEKESLANEIGAIMLTVGVINIPIIHYSVVWWNSLHQGATIIKLGKPSMDSDMLFPLLINLLGISFFVAGYAFVATRAKIINNRNQRKILKKLGESDDYTY